MMRDALQQLEKELSRRSFLNRVVKGTGLVAVLDRFGPELFGFDDVKNAVDTKTAAAVFGAMGNLIIPVDEDPGWATFEPDISQYGLNVFVKQVLLLGNNLIFDGLQGALVAMNRIPPTIGYGFAFLDMPAGSQANYLGDIFTGQFENDGVQDILSVGALVSLISIKGTFFSNFPRHLGQPGVEFQAPPASPVKTGWDIMRYRGPIGAAEEKALRDKYFDIEVVPGIDPTNPYL